MGVLLNSGLSEARALYKHTYILAALATILIRKYNGDKKLDIGDCSHKS